MKLVYQLSFFGIYLSTNLKLQYVQYYCSRTYNWPEITPVATLLCLYRVLVIVCIVPFDCQGGIWLLGWMFGGGIYCSAYTSAGDGEEYMAVITERGQCRLWFGAGGWFALLFRLHTRWWRKGGQRGRFGGGISCSAYTPAGDGEEYMSVVTERGPW